MGNEFAEKKSRVKPDTSRNGNKQSRFGADLFPSHLPLERFLYYLGAEVGWTGQDRRSHEYSDEKVLLPRYGNRQWTGAIGKEAIAHKSLPSSRQSRMLQKNISPIFSIDANVLQRKGENLSPSKVGPEISAWINSTRNSKIAKHFNSYSCIDLESKDYYSQLALLQEIKRESQKCLDMGTFYLVNEFLKKVDKEIALVNFQLSEDRGKELKQEHENKYGKSITIYDLDNEYSEEYIRYLFKKMECPEYIDEHYVRLDSGIYYKDKKYTILKQVEEEFEKAEKLRMGMGK